MGRSLSDCRRELLAVVAHDHLSAHDESQRVQLFRKEQGIGVDLVRSEQLRSHGDDDSVFQGPHAPRHSATAEGSAHHISRTTMEA